MASAFIIQVDSQLKPDSGDETTALLRVLIYEMNKTALGDNAPTLPRWTGPPPTMVQVQAILFASLSISLLSAFLAMLGKQWLNRYASTDMRGSAVERCHNRQRKLDGIVAWYFDHVMESLPLMLQAGLLLLACALARYLWDISTAVASVVIGITSLGLIFYIFIIAAGVVSEDCPYQTPGSRVLRYLGPKVHSAIFRDSMVAEILAANVKFYHPWWSRRQIIPFIRDLVLEVPRGFAIDVYRIGRAATQVFLAPLIGAYHLARGADSPFYSNFKQWFRQQTILSNFRCISWTLQTSLDKPIHQSALEHLATITDLTGLDPTLVLDCFNVFFGCVHFSSGGLMIIQGLEQLAMVSTNCLFFTLHHLWVTDPTSSVLADFRRRYTREIPPWTDFSGLPFHHTVVMTYALVLERWSHCYDLQWDDYRPSAQEHTTFTQHLVEVARAEYQRRKTIAQQDNALVNIKVKVPRWILRFALHSLSLDSLPPTSVVAGCLVIVAIDLDCDLSDIVALDKRYV